MKVWSWRQAVEKSDLPAYSKLILYTLANYMNEHGQNCFPSFDTLQAGTSLARGTLSKYLETAVEKGWLKKNLHGFGGQKWSRAEYQALFPEGFTLDKGSSCGEPAFVQGSSSNDGRQFTPEQKAVHGVNCNSPVKLSNNSLGNPPTPFDDDFEKFWLAWIPFDMDKGSKKAARKSYDKARKESTHEEIIRGVTRYLKHCHVRCQRTKHAVTWLNQHGWEDDYSPAKPKNVHSNGAAFNHPGLEILRQDWAKNQNGAEGEVSN